MSILSRGQALSSAATSVPAASTCSRNGGSNSFQSNGFNLIGISANPYFLIQGAAILIAMIANVRLSRLRRAGRV